MRRRDFITLVGATTVGSTAWLRAAPAQQAGMPVIGFLGLTSPAAFAALTAAFKQGLTEAGFVEHQNVALEYRWAHGQFDQLSARAADLVRQDVNVLAAFGTPASAIAAKCATSTIAVIVDPDSLIPLSR